MRLVYYSLANAPHAGREKQWTQSIRSLRRYNTAVPVRLFLFNGATAELLREAERQHVDVHYLGEYGEFFRKTHGRGSVLALYPTFHKFLVLAHAPVGDVAQVLYLDCDTFFFDNVDRLFDQYSAHPWYAREEPSSRRSYFAYDPNHIDEDLLEHIARSEGVRSVSPFNSGVCLLNHGIWHDLERLRIPYLDLAWRLLCGRELNGRNSALVHDPEIQQAVLATIADVDRMYALPYPSLNTWIIEQIALWLALGHLPDFSLGTFARSDVPQGGEFHDALRSRRRCVLAHYYSGTESEFFDAVARL
jgi:hypothetical protein